MKLLLAIILLFTNGEFFDTFEIYNRKETVLEGEDLQKAAIADFFVRRFDLARDTLSKIPLDERVQNNLEPLYIESLIRTGEQEKAKEEAKLLATFPIEARIKAAIPFAFFGLNDIAQALTKDLPKKIPINALVDYVKFLIYSFEYDKANERIKEKEYFFNSTPEGLLTQALLLIRLSKQDEAMQHAEKAFALKPDNPEILIFLDEHEGRLSLLQAKLEFLNEKAGKNSSLSLKMSILRTLVNSAFLQQEKKEELSKTLTEATKVLEDIGNQLEEIPEYFVLKGIVAWNKEQKDEAIASVQKALALDKSYSLAYQVLASIHRLDNRLENAALILEGGKFYSYQDPSYYRQLSWVYSGLKNYEMALNYIDHALKIDPQSADLLANKAEVLLNLKKREEAISVITKALEYNPKEPLALKIKKQLEDTPEK